MKVIKPRAFVPSTDLISSNAVETYSAWSSATTYAKDAYVDYGTHIYQSLVNNNTNHQPDVSPTQWVLIGPDNTHAMFDLQVSTQTVSTTQLDVIVTAPYANSAAFIDLVGTSLQVIVTDGLTGPEVYNETFDLETSLVADWYMYFFEPFSFIDQIIVTDIPPYKDGILQMILSGPSGDDVKIGELIVGTSYYLGSGEYGATAGIIDYSRKETDEFGVTTFVRRAFSKRMSIRLMLENGSLYTVQKILSNLRAEPAVWIGSDDEDLASLTIYGFYRDFSIDVSYPKMSYCSLEIEGLI